VDDALVIALSMFGLAIVIIGLVVVWIMNTKV
jgi:uncharacterized protein YjeT (DUF2065 family)